MLTDPLIVLGECELNKLYRQLFAVVGEGLHDVVTQVNHIEAPCRKGQETALYQEGQENDKEDNVKEARVAL